MAVSKTTNRKLPDVHQINDTWYQTVLIECRRLESAMVASLEAVVRAKFERGCLLREVFDSDNRYGKGMMKSIANDLGVSPQTLYLEHSFSRAFNYDNNLLEADIASLKSKNEKVTFESYRKKIGNRLDLTAAGSEKAPQIYGNPIDFRGLRHEPVNENGVVFLFGIVAKELGYSVEVVQAGFPDCEAKRQMAPGKWKRVRIEFEFESRNFKDHGHPLNGCDIIVCWRHNWKDCPPNLEIVELKEVIKKLA